MWERERDNDGNVFKASHEAVIFQVLVVQHWALNFTGDEHEKLWEIGSRISLCLNLSYRFGGAKIVNWFIAGSELWHRLSNHSFVSVSDQDRWRWVLKEEGVRPSMSIWAWCSLALSPWENQPALQWEWEREPGTESWMGRALWFRYFKQTLKHALQCGCMHDLNQAPHSTLGAQIFIWQKLLWNVHELYDEYGLHYSSG